MSDLTEDLARMVAADGRLVLVLDDDPTGVQSVHGVPVLATWSDDDLDWAFAQPASTVFVLTNSRAYPRHEAEALTIEVAKAVLAAARRAGREVVFVSRSDSTLRGHYPAETYALAAVVAAQTGTMIDGTVLCPAFFEAGRFTVDDVHLVRTADGLVPVGETPFAADPTFGFHASNLRDWVVEQTDGRVGPDAVVSIGLDDIRRGGPARVEQLLAPVRGNAPVIVNAESYEDLERFMAGLLAAERAGKRFIYRTGPSFPRVRGAITAPARLTPDLLFGDRPRDRHGLVLVGSHVPLTTTQLERARQLDGLATIELSVPLLLDDDRRGAELERVAAAATAALRDGDVIVYTSRELIAGTERRTALDVGEVVSDALVQLARAIDPAQLDWLIAKGGITSSDIGTKGLGVRRATVAGPLLDPGIVPVWILPEHSVAPGLPYVIFPGNVGGPDALAEAIALLREGR